MDVSRGQLKCCPRGRASRRPSTCLPFGACGWGDVGKWVDPVWGEETLCPELFHSVIISVKAKKT